MSRIIQEERDLDLVFTLLAAIVAGITAFSAYFLFNGVPNLTPMNDRTRDQGRRP